MLLARCRGGESEQSQRQPGFLTFQRVFIHTIWFPEDLLDQGQHYQAVGNCADLSLVTELDGKLPSGFLAKVLLICIPAMKLLWEVGGVLCGIEGLA